jgi:5-methylcytosine-specific restriction endonuclease McrA
MKSTASLVVPGPDIEVAVDLFTLAATAITDRRLDHAAALVRAVNRTALGEYWRQGGIEWERRHDKSTHITGRTDKAPRAIPMSTRLAVAQRDHWTCRYCGLRLMSTDFLRAVNTKLPGVFPWGTSDATTHPAIIVLRSTPDHVVPHAHGGTNDTDNLVTACGVCQFMKGVCTIEELGLIDPRNRDPVLSSWQGLAGSFGQKVRA